jgi:hypothetical protein
VQPLRRAASRAAWIAGSNSATNMPMMAITTNSSTRVNPRPFDLVSIRHLQWKKREMKKIN